MQISNRAFIAYCLVIFGAFVYIRAQSVKTEPTVAAVAQADEVQDKLPKTPIVRHGIPNSTLPPDVNNGFVPGDPPIVLPEDSAAPLAKAEQKPVVSTGLSTPVTPPAKMTEATQDSIVNQNDLGDLTAEQAPTVSPELSDRDVLRIMWGTLSDQQRDNFRAVWSTMNPDERQTLIDEVRGSRQGN